MPAEPAMDVDSQDADLRTVPIPTAPIGHSPHPGVASGCNGIDGHAQAFGDQHNRLSAGHKYSEFFDNF